MKRYRPQKLISFTIFWRIFLSHESSTLYPVFTPFQIFWQLFQLTSYLPLCPLFINGKCENLPIRKAIFILNILTAFLAYKLSTICPLFINGKYEKLPIPKDNFIQNVLPTLLAHDLSTLCPVFINGKYEKLPIQKAIFIANILATSLAPNLSTSLPLFIDDKCEKLPTQKSYFHSEYFQRLFQLTSYLPSARYLSTVNVKCYQPYKLISFENILVTSLAQKLPTTVLVIYQR